jgi:hypothetical protein
MPKFTAYANPQAVGYQGWVDDDSNRWVLFVPLDGDPVLFLKA